MKEQLRECPPPFKHKHLHDIDITRILDQWAEYLNKIMKTCPKPKMNKNKYKLMVYVHLEMAKKT